MAMTQRYAGHAVQTLAKIMTEPTAPWTARVQAAVAILRFGREGVEIEDLQERIEALEQAAGVAARPLALARGCGRTLLEESARAAAGRARELNDDEFGPESGDEYKEGAPCD